MINNSNQLHEKVAFVVLSCDKYSDLWEPCFSRLRRFWPDLPMQVYLLTNENSYSKYDVISLPSGPDSDWSTSVRRSIESLPHEYVFFWFEDAFLDKAQNTKAVYAHLDWAIEHNVDYLRLRSIPAPNERINGNIGRLAPGMPYRTTCFSSIWKKEIFLEILQDGETAADFEMLGSVRSAAYSDFYGVFIPPLSFVHGVVRGKWLRPSIKRILGSGAHTHRPVMTRMEYLRWRINELKASLVTRLPPGYAELVFSIKRQAFNFLKKSPNG